MSQESVRGSQGVVHFAACTAQVRVPWPGTLRPCLPPMPRDAALGIRVGGTLCRPPLAIGTGLCG